MAIVSASSSAYQARTSGLEDPTTPAAALRRLNLPDKAVADWQELINLGASELRLGARAIDDERQDLQKSHSQTTEIGKALELVSEKLDEVKTLAEANAKTGPSPGQRKRNQKEIDVLLKDIDEAVSKAGTETVKLFDGRLLLSAGEKRLTVDRVSLATLGKVTANGRSLSLEDIVSKGDLDTSTHKASMISGARKTIDEAVETVKELQKRVEDFQENRLRPRLGDIATTLEGLYGAVGESLTSTDAALTTATEIRAMMLASATAAITAAADGWDRERALALLS